MTEDCKQNIKKLRKLAREATGEDAEMLEWAAEQIQALEAAVSLAKVAQNQLHIALRNVPPSATGQY